MGEIIRQKKTRTTLEKVLVFLLLIVSCSIINYLGALVAGLLKLPVYLDIIGTLLASMLGGIIPGILVGLISPFFAALTVDPMAISYTMLNVMLAVVTVWFYENKWFSRLRGIIAAILLDAVIGGILGGIITWIIYGFEAEDTSSGLVEYFYSTLGFSPYVSELLGGFAVDIVDKAISVTVALIIMRILPTQFKKMFRIHAWMQAPLTTEILNELRRKRSRHMSLRIKVIALLTTAAVVIGASAIYICYVMYYDSTLADKEEYARGTAEMAARMIDGDRIDRYLTEGKTAPGYNTAEYTLSQIRASSEIIQYVYVYKILEDGCHVVFDIVPEGEAQSQPGDVIPFDDSFVDKYLDNLLKGESIDPIVTNESYGWLLTVYAPIRNTKGETVAYAGVDLSMDKVRAESRSYLVRVISAFLGIFALALAVGVYFAEYQVILPLNTMAYTASMFSENKDNAIEETAAMFHKLLIATGDETENLYNAFSSMTDDNLNYLTDIKKKNETINEMQNSLILVLADMVESRDKNTGDHVKKTAEYVKIIMDEMKVEGIYTDQLTDKFVAEVYRSAPLHDIGKISISDVILNKNGKLGEEEFRLMQSHTTAGAEIIDRVMATVPDSDSGYLNEARRMALYHHEKWNGKGYPTGLAGEEIPLSARIMAVADVFDALVSNRSYKKGFPFEKAIDIITESSGTHFDPKVAGAFLNVKDKARQIMEMHYDDTTTQA